MEKVSVVIPAYNAERVIRDTVESVLCQSHTNLEVVVVDDGSRDDTFGPIKDLAESSRIVYIRQENKGVAAARNTGLLAASGDYIAMLDSDDVFDAEKIKLQLEFMKKGGYDVSYTGYSFSRADGSIKNYILRPTGGDIRDDIMRETFILPSTVMFKRSVLDTVGPLDESFEFAEDWEWFLRMALQVKIGFLEDTLTLKRDVPDSLSKSYKGKYRCYARLYEKHRSSVPEDRRKYFRRCVGNKCFTDAVKLVKEGTAGGAKAWARAVRLRPVIFLRFHKLLRLYLKARLVRLMPGRLDYRHAQ